MIKKIINNIENLKIPLTYFLLSFLFIINLRNFLESFSTKNFDLLWQLDEILNYNSFYIVLALSIILLFYLATKKGLKNITKIVLTGFTITLLPPLLDLIISQGKGLTMTFFVPDIHKNLFSRFFYFFGEMGTCSGSPEMLCGITPGIKIEVLLVLIATFLYFKIKKINLIKNLFFVFLTYSLIFFYFSSIYIIKNIAELLELQYKFSYQSTTIFYFIIIFFIGNFLFYTTNKNHFKAILKDIRPLRLLHYVSLFLMGVFIFNYNKDSFILIDLFKSISIIIAITLAWIYSVITNNIEDQEIDKITNKNRPLIKESVKLEEYKKIAYLTLSFALIYAGIVGFKFFFLVFLFIGNYFVYSMPPLRLKKVPFLSKLFIALNSLITIMMGFLITNFSLENFPVILYPLFLIGFTAVINFIDIKDYKGDKHEGIKTLPVIMGIKKSKFFIGLFFITVYSWIFFIFPENNIFILFPFIGFLQFYLINKKNYQEKYIFITYLLTLVVFILSM
jgi:4-hydroxybenzoate polyprenyltransferase